LNNLVKLHLRPITSELDVEEDWIGAGGSENGKKVHVADRLLTRGEEDL